MSRIKYIEDKLHYLNFFKKEMEKKVSEHCIMKDKTIVENDFPIKKISLFFAFFLFNFIFFVSFLFPDIDDRGLINIGWSLVLFLVILPFIIDLISLMKGKYKYDVYFKSEKNEKIIKDYVFSQEDVEKYYGFLKMLYHEKIDRLIKLERKEGENIEGYYLLDRLYKKAEKNLNKILEAEKQKQKQKIIKGD